MRVFRLPTLFQRASFWWTVLVIALVVRILHRPESHTVFPVFATGSLHWWNDEPLYDNYKPLDFFRYPPVFAIFFSPFARLGLQTGGLLWASLSIAVYGIGLLRFSRTVLPERIGEQGRQQFLILALLGSVLGLWNGQCNALIVGLMLLAASALVERRWWIAALFLALSCACKLTPLPIVLLLCALWPRHLVGRLLVALTGLLLVPYLTKTPSLVTEQYRGFLLQLSEQSDKRWPGFRDAWLIWSVTRHLADGGEGLPDLEAPLDEAGYRVVQLTTAALLLVGVLWLKRRRVETRRLLLLTMAGGASWCLLLGPAAEAPTYVLLAPFLAWGFVDRHAWPRPRLVQTAVVLILLLGWGELTRPLWPAAPWLVFILPVGVLVFSLWLVSCAWACRPAVLERPLIALPLLPCRVMK